MSLSLQLFSDPELNKSLTVMTCDEWLSSSLVQPACTHLKTLNKKIILKVREKNQVYNDFT